jgi:pyrophosphatase PpaX
MSAAVTPNKNSQDRAVLFDFDGTMGRSLHVWRDAYRASLQERGIHLEVEELTLNCFHRCQKEVIRTLAITDPEVFKESVWAGVRSRLHQVEPYPEFLETLSEIHKSGIKIGIVTNSRRATVEPILERWGILQTFGVIITIDDVANGKPDPEPVHHAINKLNVSPSDTFFVGDWDTDIHAAKKAGTRAVAFSPKENHQFLSSEDLRRSEPNFVVDSFSALKQLLFPRG